MRSYSEAFTATTLFRVARLVLPQALLLSLFGRRIPATMAPSRAAIRRQTGR